MVRTATCACGRASITVNADPLAHGVCHCTNCKRRTGSAFGVSAYFSRSAIVARSGTMRTYAFHHAEQDHEQERHFCANCGTTLYWLISTQPERIGIAGGCFAGQGLSEPTYSVANHQKEPWVTLPESWLARRR